MSFGFKFNELQSRSRVERVAVSASFTSSELSDRVRGVRAPATKTIPLDIYRAVFRFYNLIYYITIPFCELAFSMKNSSYTFTHAICRLPSKSLVDGLRAVDVGQPNYQQFIRDHADYMAALETAGAKLVVLDRLEEFPDSVFIEDVALCLPKCAIIMRPGAPTRLGEAQHIETVLSELYSHVFYINGPGYIEAGDILTTGTEILVGLSARTNKAGADELSSIVSPFGYKVRVVETPEDILHFKTDCSLLDEKTILTTKRLAASGCFENYDLVFVEEGEEACANAIRYNDCVIMPSDFPKTTEKLRSKGYSVKTIANNEAAKLDGGMSCLSLRFTPS